MSPRAESIVVLGCRVLPSGRPTAAAQRRAAAAAAAYHDGVAPRVIASGGRRWGGLIESHILKQELVRAGVPEHAVLTELWSLTTRENAVFSAAVLRRLGAASAAIVTCAWHMRRALDNFRAAGIDAIAIPAPSPRLGPLRKTYLCGHEFVCKRLDLRAMTRTGTLQKILSCPIARPLEALRDP